MAVAGLARSDNNGARYFELCAFWFLHASKFCWRNRLNISNESRLGRDANKIHNILYLAGSQPDIAFLLFRVSTTGSQWSLKIQLVNFFTLRDENRRETCWLRDLFHHPPQRLMARDGPPCTLSVCTFATIYINVEHSSHLVNILYFPFSLALENISSASLKVFIFFHR